MSPDDQRHGTEAGHEQHLRDGEESCEPCYTAKLKAARRRQKRKTMGHRYTLPLGEELHATIAGWRAGGASLDDIAALISVETSQSWRLCRLGPEGKLYARTWRRIAEKADQFPLTAIGITRRIRALSWLGYSPAAIAAEAGVCKDTVLAARNNPRDFLVVRVKRDIAAAYDRLHMTIPEPSGSREKAAITRMRNNARRQGWLPPLAWDHIDDAREQPVGREYDERVPRDEFLERLLELDEQHAGITAACAALKLTRDALEKRCERHDAPRRAWTPPLVWEWDDDYVDALPVYGRMVARERTTNASNQHLARGAA